MCTMTNLSGLFSLLSLQIFRFKKTDRNLSHVSFLVSEIAEDCCVAVHVLWSFCSI